MTSQYTVDLEKYDTSVKSKKQQQEDDETAKNVRDNIDLNDPICKLFWHVFSGSRGGTTRIELIKKLIECPANTSQLRKEMKRDYKVIQHHLRVLEKNNLVSKMGENYGVTYFVSAGLKSKQREFKIVAEKIIKKYS